MSKRFNDSEKFKDKWYRKLTPIQKCIWEYLISECNFAGILKLDTELMSFQIGAEINIEDLKFFENRITFISDEIIFVNKFIEFQYGTLNPQNKIHINVLKELEKYNIPLPSTGRSRSVDASKDKVKDKDKDKVKVKVKDKEKKKDIFINPDYEKVFKIYKDECTNLIPLSFERRNKQTIEILYDFLEEINYDFEKFRQICKKANETKTIANKKIDFKMMINNYIGILNGKYLENSNKRGLSNEEIHDFFKNRRKNEQG